MTDTRFSRRTFGGSVLALAAMAVSKSAATELEPTPIQTIGPFYPVQRLAEEDADLTLIKGHNKRAEGRVIQVTGRVLDRFGYPVSGARLEIWQCNSLGRYAHPNDSAANEQPGYAVSATRRQRRPRRRQAWRRRPI